MLPSTLYPIKRVNKGFEQIISKGTLPTNLYPNIGRKLNIRKMILYPDVGRCFNYEKFTSNN